MAGQALQRHAPTRPPHRSRRARCRAARWRLAHRRADRTFHGPARHWRALSAVADDASLHCRSLARLGGAAAPALRPRIGRCRRAARATAVGGAGKPRRSPVGNPPVSCLGRLQHGAELARQGRHGRAAAAATGGGREPYATVPVSPGERRPATLAGRAATTARRCARATCGACVQTPRATAR